MLNSQVVTAPPQMKLMRHLLQAEEWSYQYQPIHNHGKTNDFHQKKKKTRSEWISESMNVF